MKSNFLSLLLLLLLSVTPGVAAEPEESPKAIDLLASKNLDDWFFYHDKNAKKERVLSFTEDGILLSANRPLGYFATKEEYGNFKLIVEWRWPEKPGNSGVFFRITGEPMAFPKCYEAQLRPQDTGKLYANHGKTMEGEGMREFEGKGSGARRVIPEKLDAQNPLGEWNEYVITAIDDEIVVEINGQEVNRATNADPTPGAIGIQLEGRPLEFRTIKVIPLD